MCTMLLSERQIENFDIIAAAKHVGSGAECFETCDVKVLALHAFDDLVISSYLLSVPCMANIELAMNCQRGTPC
jgi:hypothetical protein